MSDFDLLHDLWCQEAIERFASPNIPGGPIVLRYGQAQKWLNMSLKYFAVLNHPMIHNVYPYLHVPLDRVIFREATAIGVKKSNRTAWSRMDRDQYITFQQNLRRQIAKHRGVGSVPLDWEVDVWIERQNK